MSLTQEQSAEVYKKAVIEQSKAKYTESPLEDKQILKETKEIAKSEYGDAVEEKIEQDSYIKNNDYEVDVADDEDLGTSKASLNFDFYTQFLDDTSHLNGYDLFEHDLGLDGESYKPLKKAVWYYQNSIRQDTQHYKINSRTHVDNRLHLLMIATAAAGKSTIKNSNKRIMKGFNDVEGVIEVSGVSHPEQLVGKNIQKGKGDNKKTIPVLGIMAYKSVMNDESQDMLNEKNDVYAKSQRIKRIGMDTYSLNKISKKLVSDSPEDVLEYFSHSRVMDFAHPEQLESPFFVTGSSRRYFAFNVSAAQKIYLNTITDFNFDEDVNRKTWKDFLDETYSKNVDVVFTLDTLKIISHYHKNLLLFLLKHKNQNAFRYGLQVRYSMRDMFCKNVMILSKAKGEYVTSVDTAIESCYDTLLFILKTIECYNDLGNMGTTTDVWGGCCEQDAQALEYLLRKGAISKDSSNITIRKFQSVLANFYGCKTTQSRAHHYRLKRLGFVDSCQVGKNESKVWLKFIPKEIQVFSDEEDPLEFWKTIFKGDSAKTGLLKPLKALFIDDKTYKKAKGDGGVGVMGCILIKKDIRVEVYTNKNKNNNIYTFFKGEGVTLSPQTPLTKNKTTATIKHKNKGIKTPKTRPTPLNHSKSDRDTHYSEAKECDYIQPCDKLKVKKYLKNNPKYKLKELIKEFGPGVLKLKSEGLIK